jgi:hypothetical protein
VSGSIADPRGRRLSARVASRLARLRWMAIPFAAYLVITLVLPMANGAGARGDFVRHAGWVGAGCAVVLAVAALGVLATELVRGGMRALRRGGRS